MRLLLIAIALINALGAASGILVSLTAEAGDAALFERIGAALDSAIVEASVALLAIILLKLLGSRKG